MNFEPKSAALEAKKFFVKIMQFLPTIRKIFPILFQGLDFIIMLIKVTNYNLKASPQKHLHEDIEQHNFWVLLSEGAIGTNTVKVEINSYDDIDADVEFCGYKNESVTTAKPETSSS